MTGAGSSENVAVVLVPGAWEGASVWDGVVPELAGGVRVVRTVDLPYTSFAADVARVRAEVESLDGPAVLVGHSSGGSVISEAAAADGRVRGLVFVAAYAPEQGESVASLSAEGREMAGGAAIRWGADGWSTLDPTLVADALGADLPAATVEALSAHLRPTHVDCLVTTSGPAGWRGRPCAAVVATDDRILDPALQCRMGERAGASITELAASHLVPLSRPVEVAAVVSDLLGTAALDPERVSAGPTPQAPPPKGWSTT